jgi:hypothetical protein
MLAQSVRHARRRSPRTSAASASVARAHPFNRPRPSPRPVAPSRQPAFFTRLRPMIMGTFPLFGLNERIDLARVECVPAVASRRPSVRRADWVSVRERRPLPLRAAGLVQSVGTPGGGSRRSKVTSSAAGPLVCRHRGFAGAISNRSTDRASRCASAPHASEAGKTRPNVRPPSICRGSARETQRRTG